MVLVFVKILEIFVTHASIYIGKLSFDSVHSYTTDPSEAGWQGSAAIVVDSSTQHRERKGECDHGQQNNVDIHWKQSHSMSMASRTM